MRLFIIKACGFTHPKKSSGMKKNVAVVCGGDSGEYEISINSGKLVCEYLDREKYRVFLIIIRKNSWKAMLDESTEIEVDKNDFSIFHAGEKIRFDVVFNAIHGTPGEDGKLAGYFDILGIPYTNSSHVVSAITFNKFFCKQVVQSSGVSLADGVLLRRGRPFDAKALIERLKLPLFVKPNSNGSSVGVSKVKTADELESALNMAFAVDHEVLVESFIEGREIGCGVFQFNDRRWVFPLTEIISKKEFFDYEAKYTAGMSDEITPARVDEAAEIEIKATASELYTLLGCKGIVRFDFILTKNALYFLEVNTIPGFSSASIVPQQARAMGLSLTQLFGMAIENVLT